MLGHGMLMAAGGGLTSPASVFAQEFMAKAIAYYPLDSTVDSVIGDVNSFSTGISPSYIATPINGGISLNGVIQTYALPIGINETSISIGGWFNVASANGLYFVFGTKTSANGGYDIFQISTNASNAWRAVWGGTVLEGPAGSLVINTWQQVISTLSGGIIRLYVDGVLVASAAATPVTGAVNIALGAVYQNSYNFDADECFLCAGDISQSVVTYLYNGGVGKYYAQIQADAA